MSDQATSVDTTTQPASGGTTGWPTGAPQGGAEQAGGRATPAVGGGWPGEETDEQFEARNDESATSSAAGGTPFAGAEVDEHGVATTAACFEAMKAVIDPEIGINVVDLGLVYEITVDQGTAYMRMTLTSMGCPLTELIHQQATLVLTRLPGIDDADVEFVFSPPWSTEMISPDAKEELRAMGFNV